jgi:hypothetical protein
MRIRDWRVAFLFCLFCCAVVCCFAATTPLYQHKDPQDQREFQNVYQTISKGPQVTSGSGAPGFTPRMKGDIYLDTTNVHVYMATSTVTSGSWLQIK